MIRFYVSFHTFVNPPIHQSTRLHWPIRTHTCTSLSLCFSFSLFLTPSFSCSLYLYLSLSLSVCVCASMCVALLLALSLFLSLSLSLSLFLSLSSHSLARYRHWSKAEVKTCMRDKLKLRALIIVESDLFGNCTKVQGAKVSVEVR